MCRLTKYVLALQIIILYATTSQAFTCFPCHATSCYKPVGCRGGLVLDACRCCEECAKVENERCGGVFGTGGTCDEGLECVKREPFVRDHQDLSPVEPEGTVPPTTVPPIFPEDYSDSFDFDFGVCKVPSME